jgi:inositol oxygenase
VGDTFPVGCAYSGEIVLPEFFQHNPDYKDPLLQSQYGIYFEGCGLNNFHMSWGHDEYLYHVVKDYLPKEACFIIRYHSFYSAHLHGAYQHLMDDSDKEMLPWLELFRNYDLYSKSLTTNPSSPTSSPKN